MGRPVQLAQQLSVLAAVSPELIPEPSCLPRASPQAAHGRSSPGFVDACSARAPQPAHMRTCARNCSRCSRVSSSRCASISVTLRQPDAAWVSRGRPTGSRAAVHCTIVQCPKWRCIRAGKGTAGLEQISAAGWLFETPSC